MLAFTPAPQVVNVELRAHKEQPFLVGDWSSKAIHYSFHPQIGMIRELLGKAIGKLPAQFHYDCWIMVDAAPGFVRYEGPLQLMGPIVRIELLSPRMPAQPEDEKISSK